MESDGQTEKNYDKWDHGEWDKKEDYMIVHEYNIAHNDDSDIKTKKRNNDYDSCSAATAGLNATIVAIL